jgi:hypothetical protein
LLEHWMFVVRVQVPVQAPLPALAAPAPALGKPSARVPLGP